MPSTAILAPMFALAALTFSVLAMIPVIRVIAGRRGHIKVSDFKLGESDRVPDYVRIPNRNYMNLLELPVLFYAIGIIAYVTQTASPTVLALSWSYVALRIVHSAVHLTYNKVLHRLAVFAASNGVLIALWVVVGVAALGRG